MSERASRKEMDLRAALACAPPEPDGSAIREHLLRAHDLGSFFAETARWDEARAVLASALAVADEHEHAAGTLLPEIELTLAEALTELGHGGPARTLLARLRRRGDASFANDVATLERRLATRTTKERDA